LADAGEVARIARAGSTRPKKVLLLLDEAILEIGQPIKSSSRRRLRSIDKGGVVAFNFSHDSVVRGYRRLSFSPRKEKKKGTAILFWRFEGGGWMLAFRGIFLLLLF
jgi:hypothetical protein